jgi:glycosyltransferase involved in cell wall biosynthesis
MTKSVEQINNMSTKHVLMIAQSNYDYDARIIRYSKVLQQNDYQIDIICLQYGKQNKFDIVDGVNVYRIMKNFNQDSIFSYVFHSLIFLLRSFIKTFSLSNKYQYTLVHVYNMPDYLVFAALYPKLKRIPVFLDIHDLTVELFKEKWDENKFERFKFILRFSEKLSCNFIDHVITVTEECVDLLKERGIKENKITLIMNSPDEKSFSYDESRFLKSDFSSFKILYHGTLAVRFGLHYVIKAMEIVNKSNPDIEFHIYGNVNNDYAKELQELADKLNINGKVFFNLSVTHDKVDELIKPFDLGIVPYERTQYMDLALPTKAGEYALTGLPFIMSDLISVRTVFRNNSVQYVKPKETDLVAETILNLYSDKAKRKKMSENAYNDIKKISWNVMQKRYIDLINVFEK